VKAHLRFVARPLPTRPASLSSCGDPAVSHTFAPCRHLDGEVENVPESLTKTACCGEMGENVQTTENTGFEEKTPQFWLQVKGFMPLAAA